jgi:hypothetical protein
VAALCLAFIARVTLVPTGDPDTGTFLWCVLCGAYGLGDFIANVVLFIPPALALRFWGWPVRRIIGGLFLMSVAIELIQLHIPGRDSTLGDVASNTLGAALGVGLAWWWPRRGRSTGWALIAVAAVMGGIACGGLVLRPRFPADAYYGQWDADGSPYEPYHGRVLSAAIGGMPIPLGMIPDSRAVREHLQSGDTLRVRAIAGPPPPVLTQLFGIGDSRLLLGVVLLGVQRSDLVFMVTTGAPSLRLREPDLRWPHALDSVVQGDTLDIRAWVAGGSYCVRLNGRSRCGLAYAPDGLWKLIHPLPGRVAGAEKAVDFLFLLLLGIPAGLLTPRRWTGAGAPLVLLLGVALLPPIVGLAPITALDLAALAVGVALGALVPEGAAALKGPSEPETGG